MLSYITFIPYDIIIQYFIINCIVKRVVFQPNCDAYFELGSIQMAILLNMLNEKLKVSRE